LTAPPPPYLHSFPTQRSSDLHAQRAAIDQIVIAQFGEPLEPGQAIFELLRHRRQRVGGRRRGRQLPRQLRRKRGRNVLAEVHLRSEEHTSELQSLAYLVCRVL